MPVFAPPSRPRARGSTGLDATAFTSIAGAKERPDPADMHTMLLEVLEQAHAYVSGNTVLIQREDGPWTIDRSMPT